MRKMGSIYQISTVDIFCEVDGSRVQIIQVHYRQKQVSASGPPSAINTLQIFLLHKGNVRCSQRGCYHDKCYLWLKFLAKLFSTENSLDPQQTVGNMERFIGCQIWEELGASSVQKIPLNIYKAQDYLRPPKRCKAQNVNSTEVEKPRAKPMVP